MEITPDLITQFGLIQKVSTGHPALDMFLVMMLPILLRQFLPVLTEWFTALMKWERPKSETVYERQIEHKKNYDYYWMEGNDGPSNTILQKAIINYINTKTEILRQLPNADFQIKKKIIEEKPDMTGEDKDEANSNLAEHSYDINVVPPLGTWIDLKNGIEFMRNEEETDDKGKRTKKTYFLKAIDKSGGKKLGSSKEKDMAAVKLIEAFIEEALELYRQQQSCKVDYSRYLYIPVLSGFAAMMANKDEDGGAAASAVYKRYKLSEEKTFASFFHPDKESILHVVQQFLEKKGKFGIAGYPQKLGFLLYGPPGTGKTSFIKALAQHTKRSVMSIPLTKIRTNQELMDIMFDQKIKVEGEDSISLPYNKTIFVMEDVDAASDVVHRRTDGPSAPAVPLELIKKMQEAAVKRDKKDSKKKDAEIQADSDDDDKGGKTKGKAFGPMPAFGKSLFGGDDDLNLAGLLNVLDGVVDTPNRIVIMTTNHPEKLDPALIRPGRINKKIYMGRMCVEQALQMMRHYFGEVPESAKAQLRAVFVDEALSPAELETMCADFDTVQQLVDQLVARFSFAAAAAVATTSSTGEVTQQA